MFEHQFFFWLFVCRKAKFTINNNNNYYYILIIYYIVQNNIIFQIKSNYSIQIKVKCISLFITGYLLSSVIHCIFSFQCQQPTNKQRKIPNNINIIIIALCSYKLLLLLLFILY